MTGTTPKKWDRKFRNSKGFLTTYALACGYREAAGHPKDKGCYVNMERLDGGGYYGGFHAMPGTTIVVYEGRDINEARKLFRKYARTIVVQQALMKAGVT